jgi:hypothetical protein
MIFYNYESYFGKPKKVVDKKDDKPVAPDVGVNFDFKKWQWHLMVEKLVKELNYKPEEVYQLNWINALNWLTMFSMKERWLKEQQKKIK